MRSRSTTVTLKLGLSPPSLGTDAVRLLGAVFSHSPTSSPSTGGEIMEAIVSSTFPIP